MRMSTRFSEFGVYSRSTTPSNFRKAAITFKASSSNDGPRGRAGTAKTDIIKGSLGGETSVLRTFRMSGKELVKETVSQRKS